MYLNYQNDRQELGFNCIEDINSIKQLSDFRNTLKTINYKQIVILIFSKEILVAIFIFSKSSYIEPNISHLSFESCEVHQSCIIKSKITSETIVEIQNQQNKIPQVSKSILKIRCGDLQKTGPGPRAKSDASKATANRARNSKAGNSQSGISPFAQAFTVEPKFPARPGQNRDGLFGRFSARPTPDPSNPGCAGGPKSITVLSGQRNSDSSTKLTAYDGFEAKLTAKSENHLTSKHGHEFGVDDPLPRNPNQKPTKYEQTRTRLNNENKAKVREEIKSILSNTNSDIYPDVSIRGIQGRVYHSKDTNRVVGIHTEGEFAGLIMKAQPISDPQLNLLRELNILD